MNAAPTPNETSKPAASPTMAPQPKRRHWWIWPTLVLGLLLAHAATITWFMTKAISDENFAVVPNAYEKGLGYDRRKARLARTAELGWQVQLKTGSLVDQAGRRMLTVELSGRAGEPILDARMKVRLTRDAGGGQSELVQLEPGEAAGQFVGLASLGTVGLYQAEVVAERGAGTEIERGLFDRELPVGMPPEEGARP